MIELKRTALVRGTAKELVTKKLEARTPGQAAQTDAQEVMHRELGVSVVVTDREGRMFSPKPGGGSQVGGPVK